MSAPKIMYSLVCNECGIALEVNNVPRQPLIYTHRDPSDWQITPPTLACSGIGERFMVIDGKVTRLSRLIED